ncbi:hypothetical protein [Actinophytocola glycyrrhizae]|uniref:Uncharacterized protein n=1 Tax=Actinophytocola glycyrrhizae TaxID=2044873 RepID=A0ABV9RXQ4_9PSEU
MSVILPQTTGHHLHERADGPSTPDVNIPGLVPEAAAGVTGVTAPV